jgi:hypothetical protein
MKWAPFESSRQGLLLFLSRRNRYLLWLRGSTNLGATTSQHLLDDFHEILG